MLYISSPFIPIRRIRESLPHHLVRCECFDVELQRFLVYTLDWNEIVSDDAGELARVLLNVSNYEPSTEEFRWWLDNHLG